MKLTLFSFFIITTSILILNIIFKPIIEHNLVLLNDKITSSNEIQSLNKLDYRYWIINNNNETNIGVIENLYNIIVLSKNPKIVNYANFEILKNYQYFSPKDKIILFQ